MATKRYAFVNYGGDVMSIETRCSGRYIKDVQEGELALEQIIHPDLLQYYVEITDETGNAEIGYLWSDGRFQPTPSSNQTESEYEQAYKIIAGGNDA